MFSKIRIVNIFCWMVSGLFLLFCSYVNYSLLFGKGDLPQEEIQLDYIMFISFGILGVFNLIYGLIQIVEIKNKTKLNSLKIIKVFNLLICFCNILVSVFILIQAYNRKFKLVFCLVCLTVIFTDTFVKYLERYKANRSFSS